MRNVCFLLSVGLVLLSGCGAQTDVFRSVYQYAVSVDYVSIESLDLDESTVAEANEDAYASEGSALDSGYLPGGLIGDGGDAGTIDPGDPASSDNSVLPDGFLQVRSLKVKLTRFCPNNPRSRSALQFEDTSAILSVDAYKVGSVSDVLNLGFIGLAANDLWGPQLHRDQDLFFDELFQRYPNDWATMRVALTVCNDSDSNGTCFGEPVSQIISLNTIDHRAGNFPAAAVILVRSCE